MIWVIPVALCHIRLMSCPQCVDQDMPDRNIPNRLPLCSFGQHAGGWLLLTPTSDRLNTNISKGPTRIAICDPKTITRRICSGAWTYAYAISCYVMKCSYSTCGSFGKRGSPSKSLSHAYGGVSLTESPGEKSPGLLYGAPIWRKEVRRIAHCINPPPFHFRFKLTKSRPTKVEFLAQRMKA